MSARVTARATPAGGVPVATALDRVLRYLVAGVVEEQPARAVSRAAAEADAGLPVVVSGSFHPLAAVHEAAGSQ